MTGHRKAPPHPKIKNVGPGHCVWCQKVVKMTKAGKPDVRFSWHPECKDEWLAYSDPVRQYYLLEKKQGGKCATCGGPPLARKGETVSFSAKGPYTIVYFKFDIEHKIPLWKVAGLPDEVRWWYFSIDNLELVCHKCHAHKSAKETSERGHHKRLAKKRENSSPSLTKPKQKIPSRGFPKGHRPLKSRNDLKKR